MAARADTSARAGKVGPRSNPGPYFSERGGEMTAIMPFDEPRPRGTIHGERADRRRVREAEHYFRCKLCGGFIDARDLAWVEDHGGPLPHPAQDGIQ
jgi:hypothetical protein